MSEKIDFDDNDKMPLKEFEEVVDDVTLEELEKHLRDVFFARPESYFEGKRVPMRTEVSVCLDDDNITTKGPRAL